MTIPVQEAVVDGHLGGDVADPDALVPRTHLSNLTFGGIEGVKTVETVASRYVRLLQTQQQNHRWTSGIGRASEITPHPLSECEGSAHLLLLLDTMFSGSESNGVTTKSGIQMTIVD